MTGWTRPMTGWACLALSGVLLALAIVPSPARADFGIAPGSFTARMVDTAGSPVDQAGAHPDRLQLGFDFNPAADGTAEGNLKDVAIELPPGLIGNPRATAVCPRESITIANDSSCPPESQVGTVELLVGDVGALSVPIHNVEPRRGNIAEFGFEAFILTGFLTATLTPDGQRIGIAIADVVQDIPLSGLRVELWGVPADHQTGTASPRRAFLTAPTRCDVAPTVAVRVRSWQQPDVWRSASAQLAELHGCERLVFAPRLGLALERSATDTPTGVGIDVVVPQGDDPDDPAVDRIGAISLELPAGMALSPGAANHLGACGEQAAGLDRAGPASCPAASRIGTVELSTPLLSDPVAGSIYMGRQLSGTDYRLFVAASAPGIDVKLPLLLHADPGSGRLSARIGDLPPLPFERLSLRFDGGAQAPLVTPLSCGQVAATATVAPLGGGAPVAISAAAPISSRPQGGSCATPTPFAPTFSAGVALTRAAVASRFAVTVRRRDGDELLDRFRIELPAGVSARLGAVRRCRTASAPRCPAASRIGSAAAELGSGPSPLVLRGEVFLTGPYRSTRPYRRTPFGLAIVFRGAAGPFDFGAIAVRAALGLDARSGRVRIDSDPLPRVVRGIPLRIQTVAIDVDRPGFIANPTACTPTRVAATLESAAGSAVRRASPFAIAGCRRLPFRRALALALVDRRELRAGGHPGVRLTIRARRRGANLRAATVALPKLLTPSPIGPPALCSLEQAADGRCPAGARIGTATGRTPLLSAPLAGSIYLVQPRRGLAPDAWAFVRGMGVELKVRMRILAGDGGRLSARLVDLPDLPLSSFTMTLAGGERGLFTAARSPCRGGSARTLLAATRLVAHNGATRVVRSRVRAVGC